MRVLDFALDPIGPPLDPLSKFAANDFSHDDELARRVAALLESTIVFFEPYLDQAPTESSFRAGFCQGLSLSGTPAAQIFSRFA